MTPESPPPPSPGSGDTQEIPSVQPDETEVLTHDQHIERMLISGLSQLNIIQWSHQLPQSIDSLDLADEQKEVLLTLRKLMLNNLNTIRNAHIKAADQETTELSGLRLEYVERDDQMVDSVGEGTQKNICQLSLDSQGAWKLLIYNPEFSTLNDAQKRNELMHEFFALLIMNNGSMEPMNSEYIKTDDPKSALKKWKTDNMSLINNIPVSHIIDAGYEHYLSVAFDRNEL